MVITLMKQQHQEDRLAPPMQAILSILVESTELRL